MIGAVIWSGVTHGSFSAAVGFVAGASGSLGFSGSSLIEMSCPSFGVASGGVLLCSSCVRGPGYSSLMILLMLSFVSLIVQRDNGPGDSSCGDVLGGM